MRNDQRVEFELIFGEIRAELAKQDEEWGGPSHDDQHTSHDWIAFLMKHAGKAVMWPFNSRTFRRQMVRVAALAIQATAWCYRLEVKDGSFDEGSSQEGRLQGDREEVI